MSRENSFVSAKKQPNQSLQSPTSPPRLRYVQFDKVPISSVKCVPKYTKDESNQLFYVIKV